MGTIRQLNGGSLREFKRHGWNCIFSSGETYVTANKSTSFGVTDVSSIVPPTAAEAQLLLWGDSDTTSANSVDLQLAFGTSGTVKTYWVYRIDGGGSTVRRITVPAEWPMSAVCKIQNSCVMWASGANVAITDARIHASGFVE